MLFNIKIMMIICGDCVQKLDLVEKSSIDLSCIDPPFCSDRVYNNDSGGNKKLSFNDVWHGGIKEYIDWMRPRLLKIYEKLKDNGISCIHCDYHANSYLRVLCDDIFGSDNFLNEIIWKRATAKSFSQRKLSVVTDTVLVYSKGKDYTFNIARLDEKTSRMERDYKFDEVVGKYYKIDDLTSPHSANPSKNFEWRGVKPNRRSWKYTKEVLERMWNDGIIKKDKEGNPVLCGHIKYMDVVPGKMVDNLWTDISPIAPASDERIEYPTQKPVKLLERLIRCFSNENDTVLDAFMGSGTTIFVAQHLGRNFIGIDVSPDACLLAACRLKIDKTQIIDLPTEYGDQSSTSLFKWIQ